MTIENRNAFVPRLIESCAVSGIKLEGNPLIEALIVKLDALLNPAPLLVYPSKHLGLDGLTKVVIVGCLC